jgi:hypothetical protein
MRYVGGTEGARRERTTDLAHDRFRGRWSAEKVVGDGKEYEHAMQRTEVEEASVERVQRGVPARAARSDTSPIFALQVASADARARRQTISRAHTQVAEPTHVCGRRQCERSPIVHAQYVGAHGLKGGEVALPNVPMRERKQVGRRDRALCVAQER